MSAELDPGMWKQISGWLWGALLIPLGVIWKRVDGAVQKDDFARYANDIKEVIKQHADMDAEISERQRQTMLTIFEKMEKQNAMLADQREATARIETTLTFMNGKKRK